MRKVADRRDSHALAAKALGGALVALAVLVSVRFVLRTVRSAISATLWMIRWGFVLYVALWAYLWWKGGGDEHAALDSVAATVSMLKGASLSDPAAAMPVLGLAWRAAQQPTVWQQLASYASQATSNAPPPKRKRGSKKPASSSEHDAWRDLARAWGLDDVVDYVLDPAPQRTTWKSPRVKRERGAL